MERVTQHELVCIQSRAVCLFGGHKRLEHARASEGSDAKRRRRPHRLTCGIWRVPSWRSPRRDCTSARIRTRRASTPACYRRTRQSSTEAPSLVVIGVIVVVFRSVCNLGTPLPSAPVVVSCESSRDAHYRAGTARSSSSDGGEDRCTRVLRRGRAANL